MTDNRHDKNRKPIDIKKAKIIIATITVVLCFLILAFGPELFQNEEKTDYNVFMEQVESGQVEKAKVNTSTGRVTYNLKGETKKQYANFPYTTTFHEKLLTNGVNIEFDEPSILSLLFKYGTTPLFMIIFLILFLNMGKIGTDISVETVNTMKTRFKDVAGMDEIKDSLRVLSDMMKDPKYRASGARIPRGVLLQGPPGNGKTLLARAFAGETGVNFIAVNACDFGSQFVGVGSSKIKKVFEAARRNAPCVIFIDELDSVGAKRGHSSDAAGKEMNTMLTALLNQMDGFRPMDNVMVLAATNRADALDEALVRPGRFDRKFTIENPDRSTRIELFKMYTQGKKLAEDVDFDRLATRTYGYSCSKIECIVNEALILAVQNGNVVTMKNFEDALLQMDIQGFVKKNASTIESDRIITSIHEAGHAVITHFVAHEDVASVTIRPTTSGAGGFTLSEDMEESGFRPLEYYWNHLLILYAGRAAEYCHVGNKDIDNVTTGASSDIQHATKLAMQYVMLKDGIDYTAFGESGTREVMKLTTDVLHRAWNAACEEVEKHFDTISAVAAKLRATETLGKEDFLALVNKLEAKYEE